MQPSLSCLVLLLFASLAGGCDSCWHRGAENSAGQEIGEYCSSSQQCKDGLCLLDVLPDAGPDLWLCSAPCPPDGGAGAWCAENCRLEAPDGTWYCDLR